MNTVRVVLILAGSWLAWYGIAMLLSLGSTDLRSTALWFAGGILLHDFVFAPLCAAMGVGARRVLPRGWWAPCAVGAVCVVSLILIAIPVFGRGVLQRGMPDNRTVLDRNYPLGLTIAILAVLIVVAFVVRVRAIRRARGTRTDDSN